MTSGPAPGPEEWRRALQRFVDAIPHTRALGLQAGAAGPEGVLLRLPWQDDLLGDEGRGLVHGGLLTMLLDTACGAAVLPALPELEVCPTLDLRLDHFRPGVAGADLHVEARAVAVTASVVFTEGRVWQTPDEPLARGIANFARLGPRNTPPAFAAALFAEENDHG
ncbi:PaaI family thioesterase [Halomonas sp. THAF12]|uniref:PaaI family thioesterase n=1 Tax=Halomonas sp. B23F22_10 TaxID=3459515 RepID=UPI00373F519C